MLRLSPSRLARTTRVFATHVSMLNRASFRNESLVDANVDSRNGIHEATTVWV